MSRSVLRLDSTAEGQRFNRRSPPSVSVNAIISAVDCRSQFQGARWLAAASLPRAPACPLGLANSQGVNDPIRSSRICARGPAWQKA